MATLILTTVGTALGGPVGGALGALIGQQVDSNILFRPKGREGPRLQDLAVQTSQYGAAFPRVHGRVRLAGTVIWSTDLVERSERQGGGKGRPSVTSYSYSVSFAVALSSRPLLRIERIWADGSLLRGAAGDFKSETGFRFHSGHGDQSLDPLIASAEGPGAAPAYRGLAYAVFEDMQLADFGNRIPSLTFEVVADESPPALRAMASDILGEAIDAESLLPQSGVTGIALTGASRAEGIASLSRGYPMVAAVRGGQLRLDAVESLPGDVADCAFGRADQALGRDGEPSLERDRAASRRQDRSVALRFYDPERDYQPGLSRAGSARWGREEALDFPAAMARPEARARAAILDAVASASGDRARARLSVIDSRLRTGGIVSVEGLAGVWRVQRWHWVDGAVELDLIRHGLPGDRLIASPGGGRAVVAPDLPVGPSHIALFDLPSEIEVPSDRQRTAIAISGESFGWRGARLLKADVAGQPGESLEFVRQSSTLGMVAVAPVESSVFLHDSVSKVEVLLHHSGLALFHADPLALEGGANLAMLGGEMIQFARADLVEPGRYRLTQLRRGLGGTEHLVAGHMPGEPLVLLDGPHIVRPGDGSSGAGPIGYFALGIADPEPVEALLEGQGLALRPLSPVRAHAQWLDDGGLRLAWTRRSRSGFLWRDLVDAPLGEAEQAYRIALGAGAEPLAGFESIIPELDIDTATIEAWRSAGHVTVQASIVQRGTYAESLPCSLSIAL